MFLSFIFIFFIIALWESTELRDKVSNFRIMLTVSSSIPVEVSVGVTDLVCL